MERCIFLCFSLRLARRNTSSLSALYWSAPSMQQHNRRQYVLGGEPYIFRRHFACLKYMENFYGDYLTDWTTEFISSPLIFISRDASRLIYRNNHPTRSQVWLCRWTTKHGGTYFVGKRELVAGYKCVPAAAQDCLTIHNEGKNRK